MIPVIPTVPIGMGPDDLIVIAKDQPEYIPLPAFFTPEGYVITEWELTAEELARLMTGGRLRLSILTFGRPLQPLILEVP